MLHLNVFVLSAILLLRNVGHHRLHSVFSVQMYPKINHKQLKSNMFYSEETIKNFNIKSGLVGAFL